MPQNTNLNSSPYFDDFNELKNYQRVLFKPGYLYSLGNSQHFNLFYRIRLKNLVSTSSKKDLLSFQSQIAYDAEYTCVQIDDSHLGIPVSAYLENLIGKKIKGETSGVTAKVETYITNRTSVKGSYTLYIKYNGSSDTDFSRKTFADGENLLLEEDMNYSLSSIRQGA